MAKVLVGNTTPIQLDWLVAKCEGKNGILHDDGIVRCIVVAAASGVYKGTFKPTINPAQGQPILEREIDQLDRTNDYPNWEANRFATDDYEDCVGYGPTMLIAGLRCFVASKLGDEVEIPEELL